MTDVAENSLAVKRVGQYLIDAGVLSATQLDDALDRQERMGRAGFHVLLGTILEEMGAIDRHSLEAIILRQRMDDGMASPVRDAGASSARATLNSHESVTSPPLANSGLSSDEAAQAMNALFGEPASSSPPDSSAGQAVPSDELDSTFEGPANHGGSSQDLDWPEKDEDIDPAAFESNQPSASDTDRDLTTPVNGADSTAWQQDEPSPILVRDTSTDEGIEAESKWEPGDDLPSGDLVNEDSSNRRTWDVPGSEDESTSGSGYWESSSSQETDAWHENADEPQAEWSAERYYSLERSDVQQETDTGFSSSYTTDVEPTQTVGPVDLLGFKFSRTGSGLDETEVTAVISQLMRRTQTLEHQIAEAQETLNHLDSLRRYGEQSVKAADTIAQQIREEAEDDARAIRDRAQVEARRIVAESRSKHDEIIRAAGSKAMNVATEIAQRIEEHRALNDQLISRARSLLETDSTEVDD